MADSPDNAICRHCGDFRPVRHRGLCERCFANDRILAKYPFIPPAEPDADDEPDEPDEFPETPTRATPGSIEKILLLAARFAAGELLHHPDDKRLGEACPMPLMLANLMQARERFVEAKAGRVKKKPPRRRVGRKNSPPWRLYPCCLWGAITKGKCDCAAKAAKKRRRKREVAGQPAMPKLAEERPVRRQAHRVAV